MWYLCCTVDYGSKYVSLSRYTVCENNLHSHGESIVSSALTYMSDLFAMQITVPEELTALMSAVAQEKQKHSSCQGKNVCSFEQKARNASFFFMYDSISLYISLGTNAFLSHCIGCWWRRIQVRLYARIFVFPLTLVSGILAHEREFGAKRKSSIKLLMNLPM